MAIEKVVPFMTSNTTPSPYIVSASGIYSDGYDAWNAFDDNLDSYYAPPNSDATCWIKVDLNEQKKFDEIIIKCINAGYQPKRIKISISDDDYIYEEISDEQNSDMRYSKQYETKSCRYIKIEFLEKTNSYYGINNIEILYNNLNEETLIFKKTLSANVPDEVDAGTEEVHFTEKGEIFTYTNEGKKLQLGGSGGGLNEMFLSSREW